LATSITVNAAALNRPGVFVAQSVTGGLPQPIASHAVGYLFGTTPADEYYGTGSEGIYSEFLPYTPTQIASADDYVQKVGGTLPASSVGALTTYDAVKGFFDNVGVNGILYFTRVTPTPETVIDLSASGAGVGYNAFAIKVNGRYFGTPINVLDPDGDEIRVITTTGIDAADNARDLFVYLSGSGSDGFADFYKVEQTATEATQGKFRVFSRDNANLPEVDRFVAYSFTDTGYASPLNLNNETVVKLYTSIKEINFRCNSREIATGQGILYIDGSLISLFIAAANAETPGTYDPATDQSDILKDYLSDQSITVADDKIVAVSKDFSSGVGSGDKWADADAAYWRYDLGTTTFAKLVSGSDAIVPTGTVSYSGGVATRTGYLPDSVQVFYVSVAGENRAIIVNGATPDELATALRDELISILNEKELDQYYTVEAVATGSNYSGTSYAPNNGHKVINNLVSAHGAPYIRPDLEDITLTGTVAISSGTVTGTGTLFTQELGAGDVIVVNSTRFTVTAVTNDTSATVTPNTVTVSAGATARLDKSYANSFESFDYVLKIRITAKNGLVSPVLPGTNRQGLIDSNVVKLTSILENVGYESYKLTSAAKAQDFVYAIEKGMNDEYYAPGFLMAPEAYATLKYSADSDLASRSEAIGERLKVTQTLVAAAEGRIGLTEGISSTQHVALIDCGGDVENLSQAQDELDVIKRTVGSFYGHAAFYAPYLKNLNDRFVPASAFVAGAACSRFVNEGFQQPPAGARYPLRGVVDLKFKITAQQQEVTYALGLNPIRSLPNRGIVVWGARTLSSSPLFRFVNTRVILNVLIDVMNRSFDDILFESIDSAGTVYSRVKSVANQVLNQFFLQGALFGGRPEQAYLVVCGDSNNSAALLEQGTVRMDAYVATSPTLERLAITIVRTPVGQVSLLSDSFSRNEERFTALLDATNLNV
jgi:major membrane immunogen (membrane-anchored lipoprotein)